MSRTEAIDLLTAAGIRVRRRNFPRSLAACVSAGSPPVCDLAEWVLRQPAAVQEAIAGHELGHVATSTYWLPSDDLATREWKEARAWRWYLTRRVPDESVVEAYLQGLWSPWEWSEAWGLPQSLCIRRVHLFFQQYPELYPIMCGEHDHPVPDMEQRWRQLRERRRWCG